MLLWPPTLVALCRDWVLQGLLVRKTEQESSLLEEGDCNQTLLIHFKVKSFQHLDLPFSLLLRPQPDAIHLALR